MIKIGITGSLSSGKSSASILISKKRGPLFSADKVVHDLYQKDSFKRKIAQKLKIRLNKNFKAIIKKLIRENKKNLRIIEKIIHPYVRQEMKRFVKKNKDKKILFFEIPLLIESKLMKFFDVTIFIKTNKKIRLKRYLSNKGNIKLFNFLDKEQMSDAKKAKLCDHIIVNNKSLASLKKKLSDIMSHYG
tara:strand:+ start:363 stop:929 length:567 start_codon:yes stop_codon:yes gene_type:complete